VAGLLAREIAKRIRIDFGWLVAGAYSGWRLFSVCADLYENKPILLLVPVVPTLCIHQHPRNFVLSSRRLRLIIRTGPSDR
jgi:hypothetical protein